MHRLLTATLVATLICLFAGPACLGQTLPREKQAELAFEMRLDRLRDTPLYEMMRENIEQMRQQANVPSEIDLNKVNRVFGAVAIPESMEDVQALERMGQADTLPMEMFAHVEFADSATLDAAIEEIARDSVPVEMNGGTYYKPNEQADAPDNMLAGRVNDTTMVVGTEGYLSGKTGRGVFSPGLSSAWDEIADDSIRLAFDLDNSRDLINELIEQGKAGGPGMAGGMLDLLTRTRNIRLSMEFRDGGNLLTLAATGTDEEAAEEIRAGLDGMLGLAKMFGGQAIEEVRKQDEETGEVFSSILESLSAKRDGANVQVAIPKPDGFENAIRKMMELNSAGNNF